MKLSFATLGCPAWNLDTIAREAARLGFDGVELRGVAGEHIGPEETPAARAAVKSLFQGHGVALAALMGYSNFAGGDDAARRKAVEGSQAMVRLAADIGCPVVRLFGGSFADVPRETAAARVVEGLKAVAETAEACGVALALETHDDWCEGAFLADVLGRVGSPAAGACWDVANAFFHEPMERTFEALAPFLRHVHFKDAARTEKGIRSVLPGSGQVDLRKALRLLKAGGYRGYLSFEWEKKWEPELAGPEVAFPHYLQTVRALMREEGVE